MNTWHSLPSDIIKADWSQGPQKTRLCSVPCCLKQDFNKLISYRGSISFTLLLLDHRQHRPAGSTVLLKGNIVFSCSGQIFQLGQQTIGQTLKVVWSTDSPHHSRGPNPLTPSPKETLKLTPNHHRTLTLESAGRSSSYASSLQNMLTPPSSPTTVKWDALNSTSLLRYSIELDFTPLLLLISQSKLSDKMIRIKPSSLTIDLCQLVIFNTSSIQICQTNSGSYKICPAKVCFDPPGSDVGISRVTLSFFNADVNNL